MRLVFLTPPVKEVQPYFETGRSEVRWSPILKPFKYEEAPLLVDETGKIQSAQPESWKQKLSFKFRSRTSALGDALAAEIEQKYEGWRRRVGENGLASHYWEALPVSSPEHEAINRKTRYEAVKMEARGKKVQPTCPPKKKHVC